MSLHPPSSHPQARRAESSETSRPPATSGGTIGGEPDRDTPSAPARAGKGGGRRSLAFVFKLAFSAGIIAYLLSHYRGELGDVGPTLGRASWPWLLFAFSLHGLGLLCSAYRWQILARAQGDRIPLGFLVRSYLVGTFFNMFLPTRFGGDVVRIWDGSKYSRSVTKSTAIVAVERLTGIIVLFAFAAGASLVRLDMARRLPVIWIALALGIAGLAALAAFFLPATGRLLGRLPVRGIFRKAMDKVVLFRSTVIRYKEAPAAFALASVWAVLLQLNVVLYYFVIGRALRLPLPALDYFIFIPLVLLLQILPITINGLGLRETAYIRIFASYGLSAGTALSFDLVEIAFGLAVGLIGAAIYVARK
ncbi:MAG: flippase-like domain-containing protein [Candidatus Aminicenantes bacterium]|nr:flippase-like domain-containing protein [Candidatus Aminicenantes bacterium]